MFEDYIEYSIIDHSTERLTVNKKINIAEEKEIKKV
jgi:hypothetical protein